MHRFHPGGQQLQFPQQVVGNDFDRLVLFLEPKVDGPHPVLVDRLAEQAEDGADLRVTVECLAANQGRDLVGREETEVVLQDHEVVDQEAPVRRVGVDHVDGPCRGGLVGGCLEQGLDAIEADAVGPGKARQAVVALDELVAEAGAKVGRQLDQVADCLEIPAIRDRELASYGEFEGVLEPERRQPVEVEAPQKLGADGLQRFEPGGRGIPAQQRDQPGAGVLGVDVDAAFPQRFEAELGSGEPESPVDLEVGARLDQLREELAEQTVLGEVLRSDNDRSCGGRGARFAFLRRRRRMDRQGHDREQQDRRGAGAPGFCRAASRFRHFSWRRDRGVRRRTGRRGGRSVPAVVRSGAACRGA